MKTILAVALLLIVMVVKTEGQEPPKLKVAVVRVDRIVGGDVSWERLRILSADKGTLELLRKLNADVQSVQKQIIDTENEAKVAELAKKLAFLNQKANVLRQRFVNSSADVQSPVRAFVVDNFKDKYPIIVQQNSNAPDSIIWKGNIETADITDEVLDKLKEYLYQISGGPNANPFPYATPSSIMPVPAPPTFAPVPAPVLSPSTPLR